MSVHAIEIGLAGRLKGGTTEEDEFRQRILNSIVLGYRNTLLLYKGFIFAL